MKDYIYKQLGEINPNAEVERGETIQMPNGEVQKFTGKLTHKQGGEKVFLPNNSKILSEKLKVPKEVVYAITGKETKNKKMSFADLSKKYDPTPYKEILDDKMKNADDLTLRTAELMNNKLKGVQDNIFFAQEAYKESKGMNNDVYSLQAELEGQLEESFQNGGEYQNGGRYPYNPWVNSFQPQNPLAADLYRYNNLPQGLYPDGTQHENPKDIYGNIIPNADHKIWNNYWNPGGQFQDAHSNAMRDVFNQPDYDYDADPNRLKDYQTGNITNRAPLPQYTVYGANTRQHTIGDETLNNPRFAHLIDKDNPSHAFKINELGIDRLPPRPINQFQVTPRFGLEETQGVQSSPIQKEIYDDQYYTEEIKTRAERAGIDPMALSDAMKFGLGIKDLLSLQKENPYYNFAPQKAALQRINPVNTLANERAYNQQKISLERSNIPESAKQALLAQGQAQFQEGVNQVALTNFQTDNQYDNANTAAIVNAYNQNAQSSNAANYQYAQESAIRDNNFDITKNQMMSRLFDLYDDKNYRTYSRKLMSQLSQNYQVDKAGNITYIQGSKADPTFRQPLEGYTT